ncbi:MAG: NUDIX hydrolase [Eubacteriales bacterium]|nr:NUDIX hydrolase [Eubacteriales bacterium]
MIPKDKIKTMFDAKFVRVYDLQYKEGKHYYNASRRKAEDLVAVKEEKDFKEMLPDAVSCFVVLDCKEKEPVLLTFYEYRYPAGQYLLSVPAGLLDEKDKNEENPIFSTAIREIKEETGLSFGKNDSIKMVSPLSFSTPGMTDESNALVCVVMHPDDLGELSQEGAVGSELFSGFELLTKEQAMEVLKTGRDKYGNFFSMMTWAGLMYFVSDMWKK